MRLRGALYNLNDSIEMDEGFFSIATPKGTKLKRGKGSQKQKNVAVLAESIPLEDIETGEKTSYTSYYNMKVLETQKADSINEYLEESINDMSIVFSDISPKTEQVKDYKNQQLEYNELPINAQEFFLEWEGKNINNNRVARSGYHPLGHEHVSFNVEYFKAISNGVEHTFNANIGDNKKLSINYFVKNAFYLDGDILYYSSDWLNNLTLRFTNYYSVDLSEEYQPKGSFIPHTFNQRILHNYPKVQKSALKHPTRE